MPRTSKDADDPELAALDASWDEPAEDDADDDEELDAGWESPKRGRTGAEKARARREKAWLRAQRRKAHEAEIAKKQKKKVPKARSAEDDAPPSSADDAPASSDADANDEAPRPARKTKRAAPAPRSSQFGTRNVVVLVAVVAVLVAALIYAFR